MIDVIYGLDGDLIMLCIITGKENVFLLRETIEFGNKIHVEGFKFLYLSIGNLTQNLIGEILERLNTNYLTEDEKRNILNDYIFLSFEVFSIMKTSFVYKQKTIISFFNHIIAKIH